MALLDLLTRANGGNVGASTENGSHISASVATSSSRGQNLEFSEENSENSEFTGENIEKNPDAEFLEKNTEKTPEKDFPQRPPRPRLPGFNSALRAGAARDSAPLAVENPRKREIKSNKSRGGVGGSPLSRSTELAPPPTPQVRNSGKNAARQLIADLSAQVRDIVSAESLINTLVEVQGGFRPIPRRMQHPLTGEIYLEEGGDTPKAADRIAAVLALKTWGWGKDPVILDVDKQVSVSVGVDVNRLSARDAKAFLELSRKVRGQSPALPAAETTVEGEFRDALAAPEEPPTTPLPSPAD